MKEKHSSKNSSLLRGVIFIGIGTLCTKLISFLMTPFYSSWLNPAEFGLYDLLATYITLCVPLVTLQLDQAIFRFSMENHNKSNSVFCSSAKVVFPLLIIVSLAIYLIFINTSIGEYIFGFIVYFSFFALYSLTSEYLRGNELLKEYSANNILVGIIMVIASFVLVYIMRLGVSGMLFSYGISYGVSTIIILLKFKPWQVEKGERLPSPKRLLSYSLPLIPNSISWWITNVSDRTIINFIHGNYLNGIYAISCKIPTILSLLFSVFNLSFQQVAIQSLNDDNKNVYYTDLIKKVIKLLFPGSMVILSATPIIYHLVIDESYWSGIICVPFLLCGAIFLCLAQYVGDILLAQKRTKIIGGSTICAAVINIILNIITIGPFGIVGASAATMISYLIMFIIRYAVVQKEMFSKCVIRNIVAFTVIFIVASVLVVCFESRIIVQLVLCLSSALLFFVMNISMIKHIFAKIFKR